MLIEIYSRPTCTRCLETKKQLNEKNISYVEHVVDRDITAAQVKARFPQASMLPVIVVDGVMVQDPKTFQMLIEA